MHTKHLFHKCVYPITFEHKMASGSLSKVTKLPACNSIQKFDNHRDVIFIVRMLWKIDNCEQNKYQLVTKPLSSISFWCYSHSLFISDIKCFYRIMNIQGYNEQQRVMNNPNIKTVLILTG